MIDTYISWICLMIAFYIGYYADKKITIKLLFIVLGVSILWPLTIAYVVFEGAYKRLTKGEIK